MTQNEIERIMQDLIENLTTREKVAKELKMDIRTLNNEIAKVANTNPKLYKRYALKFPYKPNKYTHIDYVAFLIEAIKGTSTKLELSQKYEITPRQISLKVREMELSEETTPENRKIIELYRLKMRKTPPLTKMEKEYLSIESDKLEFKPVKVCEKTQDRLGRLKELAALVEQYKAQNLSNSQIEEKIGQSYSQIFKALQELHQIETSKKVEVEGEEK